MRDEVNRIPKRLRIARRWQWIAAIASAAFLLTCFVGWPLGYWLPSLVALVLFIPSVWLFNTRCYMCGYPAFADSEADDRLARDDRFWTRFWGKEYGGVRLPLRDRCTRCGANFI
jgi:fatty-acid desaturase